jgi:hypothetical protein
MACASLPDAKAIGWKPTEEFMTATKEAFFKPGKLSSIEKAELTDHTARAIIAQEAAARENKTEKLRLLRIQHEAENPVAEPDKKTRKAADKTS